MKFPVFFKKKLNTVIAAHPRENASPEARRMVARNPSLLALEQRFMFDGAAVNTVVDGVQEPVAQAPAERVYTQEKFSLGGNSEIQNTQLQAVVENAQEQVKDFLSKANSQALFSLFSGGQTLPSEKWAINLSQLQKEVAAGTYTIDIQLLDGRSLQGALAAFSANGPDASPVIFLNADWVNAGASTEQLTRVLIEEIGHSFDSRLNGVKDTAGDEGEAFALAVSGRTPQAYTFARISGEDDQGTVIIDGRSYSVEQANITFTQVYSGTASSLSEEANSLDNLQMVGGSGFTFTSADPLAPNFSGNNVAGTLSYTDSGSVNQNIQGVVSRLFKTNGVVEGFYFYAYGADGLIGTGDAGETGYAFVIDPSKFSNGLSRRCSSDPVDTALNNYLLGYVPPAAINDSSASAGAVSAIEAGGAANATLGRNASGNVITNDAPSSGITVSAVGVSSATTPVSSSTNASTGTPITGTYGILTLGADGTYSYAVTNGNASVQALRTASDKLYDTFTYSIKDSSNNTSSAKLTVTIEGANDNPVAVDDFNTAKVTLLSDSTAYSSTDPLGKTATGNVLPNDTDVDQYGESKTINGVAASANFVSYASGVNSTSLIFNSTNGNSLGSVTGNAAYVLVGGTYRLLRTAAGTAITVDSLTQGSNKNFTLVLSGVVDHYGVSTTYSIADNSMVYFKNGTASDGASTLSGSKSATVVKAQTVSSATVTVSVTEGVVATGMTVSDSGGRLVSGTTVTGVTTSGSNFVISLSSTPTSALTSGTLSFSSAAGTTLEGKFGSLVLSASGDYVYTPFVGPLATATATDVFRYTMKDDVGATSQANLTITLFNSAATDPNAIDDLVNATETSGTNNTTAGSNPQGNVLAGTIVLGFTGTGGADTSPSGSNSVVSVRSLTDASARSITSGGSISLDGVYGSLTLFSNGSYTYTVSSSNAVVDALNVGDVLTDTFVYGIQNTGGGKDFANLSIIVNGANDAPVAVGDVLSGEEDTPLIIAATDLLGNDTDVDNTLLTITSVTSVSGGTVVLNADGTVTFTPTLNFSGAASFTYVVSDGAGGTSTGTVIVNVSPVNDAPVAKNNSYGAFENTLLTGKNIITNLDSSAGKDSDVENSVLSIASINNAAFVANGTDPLHLASAGWMQISLSHGTVFVKQDGSLDYKPATGDLNGDTFSYVVTDGADNSSSATVTFNVLAMGAVGLSVSGPAADVSEGSIAVFEVSLTAAQGTSTNLSLSLSDISTNPDDYMLGDVYYLDGNGDEVLLTVTSGVVSVPAGVANIFVRVQTTADSTFEGSESLTLTATLPVSLSSASASANANIIDDGTGTVYNPDGTPDTSPTAPAADNDKPTLTITGPTNPVSEGSVAVFEVTLSHGIAIDTDVNLTLSNIDTASTDYSALGINAGDIYYLDGNGDEVALSFAAGKINLPANITTFYVRVQTTSDETFEGGEDFKLTASLPSSVGGSSANTTASIIDDGTGTVYNPDGTPDTSPTAPAADNDKPTLTITGPTNPVSEGSVAVFEVTLSNAIATDTDVNLTLSNIDTVSTDYSALGINAGDIYYLDGNGDEVALSFAAGKINLPANITTFYVRVETTSDDTFEGGEDFKLTASLPAAVGGSSANTTASIIDDGTGTVYNPDGTPDTSPTAPAADNDKPTLTITGPTNPVSEGSVAVFEVTLSHGIAIDTDVNLTLSNIDTATTDYSALGINAGDIYYLDGNGDEVALSFAAGKISLPANITTFYVRVQTTSDDTFEGGEDFKLTASLPSSVGGSSANTTASIIDDGTGTVYNPDGTPDTSPTAPDADNDKPTLTITGPTNPVSEGSVAVFEVTLSHGIAIDTDVNLTLSNIDTVSTDYSALGINAGDIYYLDGNGDEVALSFAAGKISLPANITRFYVRVETTSDDTFEGGEDFKLTASLPSSVGGSSANTTASIIDDGTGTVYNPDGTPDTSPTAPAADNDKPTLTITGPTNPVSEGSVAVFEVTLSHGIAIDTDVNLTLSNIDTATTDYSALGINAGDIYYLDGNGDEVALSFAAGKISLPASITRFYVRVQTTSDDTFEGGEDFKLTASLPAAVGGSSANTTASIIDDGTGTVYNPDGTPDTSPTAPAADNDKPTLTITGPTNPVSEGSVAVFEVTLSHGIAIDTDVNLTLSNIDTVSTDYSALGINAGDIYYLDGNGDEVALSFAAGKINLPANITTFYVRVQTTSDDTFEGGEDFKLTASLPAAVGGSSANTTASIIDDGTGTVYNPDGTPDTSPTAPAADNDKPTLTITGPTNPVSEGSVAVFEVTLSHGIAIDTDVNLTLANIDTVSTDYSALGINAGDIYYLDGNGDEVALSFAAGKISLPANITTFYVRVETTSDDTFEGGEDFKLTASLPSSVGGSSANTTASIIDDGTGTVYNPDGTPDTSPTAPAADNDKPTLTITGPTNPVSEGSVAVFEVTLSNAIAIDTDVNLTLSNIDTVSTDYSALGINAGDIYYLDGNGDEVALSFAAGKISLPANITRFYVRAQTTSDDTFEGSEDFKLTASLPSSVGGSSANTTASIIDDGTGTVYNPDGTPDTSPTAPDADNDKPTLTITGPTNPVSEGSVAVFEVTLSNAIATDTDVNLTLSNIDTVSTDYSALGINAGDIYYLDGNGDEVALSFAAGKIILPANITRFYVRAQTTSDDTFEGSEDFKLTASLPSSVGGSSANTTASIIDDGTGTVYNPDGTPDTSPTAPAADNDKPTLTITGPTNPVSEGSVAVFEVTLSHGIAIDTDVNLTLSNIDTVSTDYSALGINAGDIYYLDGNGDEVALSFAAGKISLPASITRFYVRVQTTSDNTFEGGEDFKLTASLPSSVGGSSANTTASIIDDGTGTVYNPDGTPDTSPTAPAADNDKPTLTITGPTNPVSEGSVAVFEVTLSNAIAIDTDVNLTLSNIDTASTDYSALGINAGDIYYLDGNGDEVALSFAAGKISLPASITRFYVRVQTSSDSAFEGAESLRLSAALPLISGSSAASHDAVIIDDGSGTVYNPDGSENTEAIKDDDRPKPLMMVAPTTPPPATSTLAPGLEVVEAPTIKIAPFNSVLNAPMSSLAMGPVINPEPARAPMSLGLAPTGITIGEVLTNSAGFRALVNENAPAGLSTYRGVTDQFIKTDVPTKISMPYDAFVHSKADAVVKLDAKMADNTKLPTWVRFDSQTGAFEIASPKGFKGKLELKVLARDSDGNEAIAIFKIFVGDEAPSLKVPVKPMGRNSLSEKLLMASLRNQTSPSAASVFTEAYTGKGMPKEMSE